MRIEDRTIMNKVNKEIVAESIAHYGTVQQSIVCMEECSELIQAISKEMRGHTNKDHLAEEMADVLICIEMTAQIYGIDADVLALWIEKKQQRIKERMAQTKNEGNHSQLPNDCLFKENVGSGY